MMLALSPVSPLQRSVNPILAPSPTSVDQVEGELTQLPHFATDQRLTVREIRRRHEDCRMVKTAAQSIGQLPQPDEAIHLAISGRFALFHCIPAIIELAGCSARSVTIATLGFSRQNIDDIANMLDAGRIGSVRLLCSHYFKGTSAGIYDHAAAVFATRADRAEFLSLRTHAKLLLIELASGAVITIESSANLRSCKNIETMTLIGSPAVFEFHRNWIDSLFQAAAAGRNHK